MSKRSQAFSPILVLFLCVFFPAPGLLATDEECMTCHEDKELKSGQDKSLYVDYEKFVSSIHGRSGMSCVRYHTDLEKIEDFPHPEKLKAVSCAECHQKVSKEFKESVHGYRANEKDMTAVACSDCHGKHEIKAKDDYYSPVYPLNLPQTCESCHLEKVTTKRGAGFISQYEQSIHFRALEKAGLTLSANCSHCHGAHDIKRILDPGSHVSRMNIIRTCGACHVGIERNYLEGVHGKDYLKKIKDVPVCTDCHREHDIRSPRELSSSVYATRVATVCSRCHDNEALARQYGFLTGRLKTYSDSFHGTASKFGEARVANCSSCHGFHDIRPSGDPKSSIHPDNLPRTCGKCHAGAGMNFAKGKIHVVSEKTGNRWAYFVKTFYIVLIAVIIFLFIAFIAADLSFRLSKKWKA